MQVVVRPVHVYIITLAIELDGPFVSVSRA